MADAIGGNMGQEITLNGEPQEISEDTTGAALKEIGDIPVDHIIKWENGGEKGTLSERDTVGDIPEGSVVTGQPHKGEIFG